MKKKIKPRAEFTRPALTAHVDLVVLVAARVNALFPRHGGFDALAGFDLDELGSRGRAAGHDLPLARRFGRFNFRLIIVIVVIFAAAAAWSRLCCGMFICSKNVLQFF